MDPDRHRLGRPSNNSNQSGQRRILGSCVDKRDCRWYSTLAASGWRVDRVTRSANVLSLSCGSVLEWQCSNSKAVSIRSAAARTEELVVKRWRPARRTVAPLASLRNSHNASKSQIARPASSSTCRFATSEPLRSRTSSTTSSNDAHARAFSFTTIRRPPNEKWSAARLSAASIGYASHV